jgi:N-acetylmuramoyl-L-alanine amidase
MNFSEVSEREKRMRTDGIDGAFKIERPALVSVKNEPSLLMQVIKAMPEKSKQDFFYTKEYDKNQIVLHCTEGNIHGDLTQLMRDGNHVSVPFVIARDGSIYRLFGSSGWAFHIGPNPIQEHTAASQKSIAIELSNYGPLKVKGNDLINGNDDVYCSLDDDAAYIKLDTPFGNDGDKYRYFAAFTDEQYDALIVLLRYLTAAFGIPRAFLPESVRFLPTSQAATFKGIVTHVNYRKDKVDIGPAFNWNRVMNGVTDPTYTSTASRGISTRGLDEAPVLTTEKELDGKQFFRKRKTDFKEGDPEPIFD